MSMDIVRINKIIENDHQACVEVIQEMLVHEPQAARRVLQKHPAFSDAFQSKSSSNAFQPKSSANTGGNELASVFGAMKKKKFTDIRNKFTTNQADNAERGRRPMTPPGRMPIQKCPSPPFLVPETSEEARDIDKKRNEAVMRRNSFEECEAEEVAHLESENERNKHEEVVASDLHSENSYPISGDMELGPTAALDADSDLDSLETASPCEHDGWVRHQAVARRNSWEEAEGEEIAHQELDEEEKVMAEKAAERNTPILIRNPWEEAEADEMARQESNEQRVQEEHSNMERNSPILCRNPWEEAEMQEIAHQESDEERKRQETIPDVSVRNAPSTVYAEPSINPSISPSLRPSLDASHFPSTNAAEINSEQTLSETASSMPDTETPTPGIPPSNGHGEPKQRRERKPRMKVDKSKYM